MYLRTIFVNCTLLWRLGKYVQKRKTDLFWDVEGCSGGDLHISGLIANLYDNYVLNMDIGINSVMNIIILVGAGEIFLTSLIHHIINIIDYQDCAEGSPRMVHYKFRIRVKVRLVTHSISEQIYK